MMNKTATASFAVALHCHPLQFMPWRSATSIEIAFVTSPRSTICQALFLHSCKRTLLFLSVTASP